MTPPLLLETTGQQVVLLPARENCGAVQSCCAEVGRPRLVPYRGMVRHIPETTSHLKHIITGPLIANLFRVELDRYGSLGRADAFAEIEHIGVYADSSGYKSKAAMTTKNLWATVSGVINGFVSMVASMAV